jgi:hypothetical protein
MKTVYETQIEIAKNLIVNSTDSDLFSNEFEEKIYQRLKIDPPMLDTNNVNVKIGSETITSENPPLNISYTPGRLLEYVEFTTPVLGNLELFQSSFKNYFHRLSNYKFEQGKMIFKQFSHTTISGNESEISKLRSNFRNSITEFQRQLEEIKMRTNSFNLNDLKECVSTTVAYEIKRRTVKKESEKQLNPFA